MALPLMNSISKKNKLLYDLAIRHQTRLFGIPTDIYYPTSTGHYSGLGTDITYREVPDFSLDLLIPSAYSRGYKSKGDVRDNLDSNEFICYVPTDYDLPELTKLVCHTHSLGTFQYLVKDPMAFRTQFSDVYCEYIITPYVSFNRNTVEESDNEALRDDYMINRAMEEYSDNKSIHGPERLDNSTSEINTVYRFKIPKVVNK